MGESLSPERLQIYAADLADLDHSQLGVAFGRARRECRFFPKIAELRDLAGFAVKDLRNVEAEAAWKWANDYLRKWGVDLLPIYSGGNRIDAPALPQRIDYALRRIGGLSGLNQITEDNRAFMFRDFCESYNLVPTACALTPQLTAKFPIAEGHVKQLGDGTMQREIKPVVRTPTAKAFPQSLETDQQRRARRETLRQQAAEVLRRAAVCHTEGNDTRQSESGSRVGTQAQACD
jgi:hypothetical protein